MSTSTAPFSRVAAIAGVTVIAAITTVAAQSASATQEPGSERPCFIAQPRWNTAIDGPPPTCPRPTWQQAETRSTSPVGSVRRANDDFGV